MSDECPACKIKYNRNTNIPIMLSCDDTICKLCINFFTQAYSKEFFECPVCCNNTKSEKKENKALYPKDEIFNTVNTSTSSVIGGFQIIIKFLDRSRLTMLVTKNMKVGELINKVASQKGMNASKLFLAFKQPLKDKEKTLENYGITSEVTFIQVSINIGGCY